MGVRAMKHLTLRLTGIKFLGTGMDGGHTYIRGKGSYDGEPAVDVYVHFATTELEDAFQSAFTGGDIEVRSPRWDVLPAIGLSLWEVAEWRLLGDAQPTVPADVPASPSGRQSRG